MNYLASIIKNNYSIIVKDKMVSDILGYPHLKVIKTDKGNFVLKELKQDDLYLKNLEYIYGFIAGNRKYVNPIISDQKKYICNSGHDCFVLFEELNHNYLTMSPGWWADCLNELHKYQLKRRKAKFMYNDFFSIESNFYRNAKKYMSIDSRQMVVSLLEHLHCKKNKESIYILNHGDPLQSNVMIRESEYVLIDFENTCMAPKEYDLQRHLCDYLINCAGQDFYNYYYEFIETYQKMELIDFELLHDLYILDFCRTFCWLHIVGNDETRPDYIRQKKSLDNYIEKAKQGFIIDSLNFIEEGTNEY